MVKIIDTGDMLPGQQFDPDTTSWIYNGLDCALTAEIWSALRADATPESDYIYYNISQPLCGPILDMNMAGILVDPVTLHKMRSKLQDEVDFLEARLNRILQEGYGVDIKLSSPKDKVWFLYECLGLPKQRKRNSKGGFSLTTDRQALEKLQHYFLAQPFINHMLLIADIVKQLQFLKTKIDNDYRMRCNFNIAGTNTGRLASSYSDMGTGSNLQNVGRRLRRIFIAPKGKKFANLDLEQADSRNVGATCWNRFVDSHGEAFAGSYLDACESGDLHTTVTKMARPELEWPESLSEWRNFADTPRDDMRGKSYRDASKAWGHGSNYLLTAASAVKKVPGVTIQMAEAFKRRYFEAFPCIPEWHDAVAQDLLESACLTTIWGRKRYFFDRLDDQGTIRKAVAYEGQSPTADEINQGLLRLWREGKRFPGFQLVCQVHDSVLFEYNEECENEIIPWAIEALRVPLELKRGRQFVVPTEAKVGWNWGDFNDDPKRGEVNLDGLAKWKGHDKRQRQVEPRDRLSISFL